MAEGMDFDPRIQRLWQRQTVRSLKYEKNDISLVFFKRLSNDRVLAFS